MTCDELDDLVSHFNAALCRGEKRIACGGREDDCEVIRKIFSAPSTPPDADWDVQWDGVFLVFKMKGRS